MGADPLPSVRMHAPRADHQKRLRSLVSSTGGAMSRGYRTSALDNRLDAAHAAAVGGGKHHAVEYIMEHSGALLPDIRRAASGCQPRASDGIHSLHHLHRHLHTATHPHPPAAHASASTVLRVKSAEPARLCDAALEHNGSQSQHMCPEGSHPGTAETSACSSWADMCASRSTVVMRPHTSAS